MSRNSPAVKLLSIFSCQDVFRLLLNLKFSAPIPIRATAQTVFLAILMLVGLTACASNTVTKQTASHQILSANAAVSQSVVNDARTFAPLELRMAERKLEQARVYIENKDFYMAQILGEQAEIDAQYAEAKAQSIKVEDIVAQLQENNRTLEDEISRANSLDTSTKVKQ